MKGIRPIDQNLIFPFGKTCECLGHVVPRHSKKYHFASCRLFLGGSHRSRTKSIHNFSKAVRTAAITKLYFVAGLQCPFCERLCEIACSDGSNFHSTSVHSSCCLCQKILYLFVQILRNLKRIGVPVGS